MQFSSQSTLRFHQSDFMATTGSSGGSLQAGRPATHDEYFLPARQGS
jgi:hypothetical protein